MVIHSVFSLISGGELFQLQQDARASLRKAYALGTFDNLNIQWVKYLHFCVYFDLRPFPATTLQLVWYVQYLSRTFKSHCSIVGYLAGIKTLHCMLNYNINAFSGFLLKLTLRGLCRNNQHVIKRAVPMMPVILRKLHTSLDHSDLLQAIFWGVCILAFSLLFRKSNLVPVKVFGFDKHRQLTHGDCVVDTDTNRVTVGIRWAKNHQFTKELLTFPLPRLPGSVLCPLQAINNIKRLVRANKHDHLFQLPQGQGSLTYRRFQKMLRDRLKGLNIDNFKDFSSHSFRRGGTMFAFLCGVPTEMIKLLGNWTSDAYLTYLEFPFETRSAACELIKMRLLAMEHMNK